MILILVSSACYGNNFTKKSVHDNDDEFTLIRNDNTPDSIYIKDGIFFYSGTISDLIGYLFNISSYQIMFRNMVDYNIIMTCSGEEIVKAKRGPVQFLEKRLGLDIESESMAIDGITLIINDFELLQESINDKEENSINLPYITDSDHIKADKATISDIANFLTNTKHKLYYYAGEDNTSYSWDFNYSNNQLMRKELEVDYGISLKRENLKLPVFVISPSL